MLPEFLAEIQRNSRSGLNSVEFTLTEPDLQRWPRHHGQPRQLRTEVENRDFAPESLADSHQGAKGGINNAKFTMTEPAPPRSLSQARHSKSATRHTCGQQTPKLHLSTSSAAATALAIALTLLTLSCGSPNSTTQPSATPTGTYLLTLTSTSPQASSPPTQSLIVTIH